MAGHFGRASLVTSIGALVLLVIHLAVPFGFDDFDAVANGFGQSDEAVMRSTMAERHDLSGTAAGASPGLTLAGTIIALVAGVLLLGLGMVPMPVLAARFVGWFLGLLGSLGAMMATISSAYWVGLGFTTLLSLIPGNAEPVVRAWMISPVLVLAGGTFLFIKFLGVMSHVAAKRDGLRTQAQGLAKGATFALVFAMLVLVLPWSFQILEGADRRDAGHCFNNDPCAPSYTFFSAYGHGEHQTTTGTYTFDSFGGVLGIAEATKDQDPGLFQGLAFSIQVMVATAWVGYSLTMLAMFGTLFSSAFKLPAAARHLPLANVGTILMLAWSAIMFVLSASYMWKPSWNDVATFGTPVQDQLWLPGFLSFAAGAAIVFWALHQWGTVKEVLGKFSAPVAKEGKTRKGPVSFD